MKKYLLRYFFTTACLFTSLLYGQDFTQMPEFKNANKVWMHCHHGLDFNTNPPTVLPSSLAPIVSETIGVATLSDPQTGELLFYSDGYMCFNRNHQVMPDGFGLANYGRTMQNVCIVPFVNDPDKYYLFYIPGEGLSNGGTNNPTTSFTHRLLYSVVDMSQDNGLGDVDPLRKNVVVADGPYGEMIAAVPGNNCDIWLIVHPVDSPAVHAYHITAAGIDPDPVISLVTNALTGPGSYTGGNIAVSPDRKMLAISSNIGLTLTAFNVYYPGATGAQVAKFNATTGMVSNNIIISDTTFGWGTCFSPDNSKLYCTYATPLSGDLGRTCGYLCQYDLSNFNGPAIGTSQYVIPYSGGMMRRKGDSILFNTFQAHISAPNQPGPTCGFQLAPLVPGVNIPSLVVGNDVVFPFSPDTFTLSQTDTCFIKKATLHAPPGYQQYIWNDGTRDSMIMVYTGGSYTVTYTDGCHIYRKQFNAVNVGTALGNDTIICSAPPLLLRPELTSQPASLLWQDNSSGNAYPVMESGQYWVQMNFTGGCVLSDTIFIVFEDVQPALGEDIYFCEDDLIDIPLKVRSDPAYTMKWSTGSQASYIQVKDTGLYWVTVNASHCVGSDSIYIGRQFCSCQTQVPSAFSPNGDGLNDVFLPFIEQGCSVSSYSLYIYNRYGQLLFSSFNPAKGWDGTYKNRRADAGTYMYQVRFIGGTQRIDQYKKGDITLLR